MGDILKRHGLQPAPERKKTTTWNEFIRSHLDVLVATDFFSTEVWTWCGLVTYYVLFFLHIGSRQVGPRGATPLRPVWWFLPLHDVSCANVRSATANTVLPTNAGFVRFTIDYVLPQSAGSSDNADNFAFLSQRQ